MTHQIIVSQLDAVIIIEVIVTILLSGQYFILLSSIFDVDKGQYFDLPTIMAIPAVPVCAGNDA